MIALGWVGIAAAALGLALMMAGVRIRAMAPHWRNLALREPIPLSAVLGAAVILAGLALLDGRWLPRTGVAR